MNASFFFDTKIAEKNNKFFAVNLNYTLWKSNYLPFFKHIIVHTRVGQKEHFANIMPIEGKGVTVSPIVNYSGFLSIITKYTKVASEVAHAVSDSDFVIARMPSVLGALACRFARKSGKPYIVEMVACPLDGYWNHQNFLGKILAPIMFLATRSCVKKSPNVIYVTNNFLQGRYPTRGKAFACSDVMLKDNGDETILRKRLDKISNMDIKDLSLCTIANVGAKYKGHKYVFKAVRSLKKKGINITYLLIGGGDDSRLRALAHRLKIEENVKFLGNIAHGDIFQMIDGVDIYVQPSLQEGLSRAVVEAMSRACPVIASDAGGNPELVDEKMVVHRRKTRALVKLIEEMTPEQLTKFATQNYSKSQEFSPEILAKKREMIFHDVIEKYAARPDAANLKGVKK